MIKLSSLPIQLLKSPFRVFNWWRGLKRTRRISILLTANILMAVGTFSYLTNPFVRFSIIVNTHPIIELEGGEIDLRFEEAIVVRDDPFFNQLAKVKSSWHIITSRFTGGPKATSSTVDEIVTEIQAERFNPDESYLISGDHFSVFYPRSLGIFYHSILDYRTVQTPEEWRFRQLIYLKSLAYALEVFSQTETLSTTIVPVGPRSVVLMNIYAYPSDTLFSLLYAFDHLLSQESMTKTYPLGNNGLGNQRKLVVSGWPATAQRPDSNQEDDPRTAYSRVAVGATQKLLDHYRPELRRHFDAYWEYVYNPDTGLVRYDIELSGTKDIAKFRQSAFYDNVIAWKTHQLAQRLDIIEDDPQFLSDYRQRILTTFWLSDEGHFLEDLSYEARQRKYYSSDWLIAYQVGFLDADNQEDRQYLIRAVDYIQRNAIDQPVAIQYSADRRDHRLHSIVRWTAPEYGSTAIWSNWGMEYTKLLIRLYQETGDEAYLLKAEQHLDSYAFNIKRYRGYPEVYNPQGDFFRTPFYKSIRQTGWVVTYQQARLMLDSIRQETLSNQDESQSP